MESKVLKVSLSVIATISILLALWLYRSGEGGDKTPIADVRPPTSANPADAKILPHTPADNVNNLTGNSGSSISTVDTSRTFNNGQPQPDQSQTPLVPDLSDEALDKNWLKAHGFPDQQDYIRLNKVAGFELGRLANSGDIIAMSLFGGQLMGSLETKEQGQAMLLDAAARGSIFALHELANRSGPGSPGGSIERQIAFRQAALTLGDISIVPFLTQDVDHISNEQYAMSQILFADAMAQISALRMQRTGQGLVPNLRPSINQRKK